MSNLNTYCKNDCVCCYNNSRLRVEYKRQQPMYRKLGDIDVRMHLLFSVVFSNCSLRAVFLPSGHPLSLR